ncbi:hypothetical protein [Cerasicoccus frondis]|uniref:hypothetical protein n=1 Tax=Cerasicoccus frondis TaxID=490090 RepID=UPI0028526FDE|nr:hypothetical protein [Cerasicoccus frondis]
MKKHTSSHAGRALIAAAASFVLCAGLSASPIYEPVISTPHDLLNKFEVTGASTTTWTELTYTNPERASYGSLSAWRSAGALMEDDSGSTTDLSVMNPGYPATYGLYSWTGDYGVILAASGSNIKTVIVQSGKIGQPDFYDPENSVGTPDDVLYWNDPLATYPSGHSHNSTIAATTKFGDTFTYTGGPIARYSVNNGSSWTVIQARPTIGILAGAGVYDTNYYGSYFSFTYQWDLSAYSGITDVEVAIPNIVHESQIGASITTGTAYAPVIPKTASTTQVWNGGTANWNTANWDSSASWSAGNNASFSAADTVTVDAAVTVADLLFTANATLSGSSTITLKGYVDVDSGDTATISAPIAGTSGLHKTGEGTAVISGTNTFSNGVYVYEGVLKIGSTNAIPSGNRVKLGKDTELDLNGYDITIDGFQADPGSDIILATGDTLQIDASDAFAFMRGQITGAGQLEIIDGDVYFYEETPSFTGELLITEGAVAIESTVGNGLEVNVGADGIVFGRGTIDGDLDFVSGGVLYHDNAAGNLTVDGDVDLSNALIVFETAPGVGSHTVLSVTGSVTLGSVSADPLPDSITVSSGDVIVTYY